MNIKHLVSLSLAEGKIAAENLSRLKGFNLSSLQGLILCVKWSVKRAEEVGLAQGLAGADKQAFAVELVLQIVPMPFWLAPIARAILPHIIDAVVDALKDKFGK